MTGSRHDVLFHVFMPISVGVVSLAFICLGGYALVLRRPFALRARWMLVLLAVIYVPWLVMHVGMALDVMRWRPGGSTTVLAVVAPLMILALLAFFVVATRGYLFFSVTQDSFRNALVAAVTRLNLPFEERLSTVRLPTIPVELQAAVQGWIGTGQLRIKGRGNDRVLTDIAKAMDAEFASGHPDTNMVTAILNLIMGVLLAALVFAIVAIA